MKLKVYTVEFNAPKWVNRIITSFLLVLFISAISIIIYAGAKELACPTATSNDTIKDESGNDTGINHFQAGDIVSSCDINRNFLYLYNMIKSTDNKATRNYVTDYLDNSVTLTSSTAWQSISGLSTEITTSANSDILIRLSLEIRDDQHSIWIGIFHNGTELTPYYRYYSYNDATFTKSIVKVVNNVNAGNHTFTIKAKTVGTCCGEYSIISGLDQSLGSFMFVEELKK